MKIYDYNIYVALHLLHVGKRGRGAGGAAAEGKGAFCMVFGFEMNVACVLFIGLFWLGNSIPG